MYTINQDFLHKAIGEIIDRIEACGASPALTHAVTLAVDLRRAIGNQYNPADPYALVRVAAEVDPGA